MLLALKNQKNNLTKKGIFLYKKKRDRRQHLTNFFLNSCYDNLNRNKEDNNNAVSF